MNGDMEYRTLSNGNRMPMVGFGVFQVPPEETKKAVLSALKVGYRLIDTAHAYGNEAAVGEAIRESGIPRDEVFVTTKLWISDFKEARVAAEKAVDRMGIGAIDLILLHQSMGDYFAAWRGLEQAYKEGAVRAIGVSNFFPATMENFCLNVEVKPMVNQIELHPFFQQPKALEVAAEFGTVPEAWGPFDEGKHGLFTDPVLTGIGEKYGKSAAQVALRWNIQRGVVVLPKSTHEERMRQNLDVMDFQLSKEDMDAIAKMDLGHSEIIDHSDPGLVKALNSFGL